MKVLKKTKELFLELIASRLSAFIFAVITLVLGWLFGSAGDFISIPDRVVAVEGTTSILETKVDGITDTVDENTNTLEDVLEKQEETNDTVKDIYKFLIEN